jgi:hypothetical protein
MYYKKKGLLVQRKNRKVEIMLVKEFKENAKAGTPEGFLNILPENCYHEGCGSPMEISAALTDLHCSNPRCPAKLKMRTVAMFKDMGVKGVGPEVAKGMYAKFSTVDNPLIFLGYQSDKDGPLTEDMSLEASKKIEEQIKGKTAYTLWEYVRLANLPYIQTSAMAIFGDYDDLEKAYADIEQGGVEFIAKKLGVKTDESDDISVRAVRVFETLMTFKKDLLDGLGAIDIIKRQGEDILTYKAVCSDEVGEPFKTKADFYNTVNTTFDGKVHIDFLTSATKSIDYLIWAGADGSPARVTSKVKKVQGWNEKYKENKAAGKLKEGDHEILIMTAKEFMGMLEAMTDTL